MEGIGMVPETDNICFLFRSYRVFYVPKPGIGAQVKVYHSVHGCVHVAFVQIAGNPPIQFVTGIEPDRVINLDAATNLVLVDHDFFSKMDPPMKILRLPNPLEGAVYDLIHMGNGYVPAVFGTYQGDFWIHDPGEVANDYTLGGQTARGAFDYVNQYSDETSYFHDLVEQRVAVWTMLAAWGKDQLHQRVAWALYQIFLVNSLISRNIQTED